MGILRKIRLHRLSKEFQKKIETSRTPKLVNLSEIKQIGLLFSNQKQEQKIDYSDIYNTLTKQGYKISSIIFNNCKLTENTDILPFESCINSKKFYKKSIYNGNIVNNFIIQPFDLLIDLSYGGFETQYITGLSKASLKTGFNIDCIKYYDIYFKTGNNEDTVNKLNNILDYLSVLTAQKQIINNKDHN